MSAIVKEEVIIVKKLVEELKKIRGRGTELVSVYIPAGYDIRAIQRYLEQEWTTAQNIKSDTTRKNVQAALEKIINFLKGLKKTPPNGLVIFCGNVAGEGSKPDYKLWALEPPVPLSLRLYRCDNVFVVEPLEELINLAEGSYGLVVVDTREATFGILRGRKIDVIKRLKSLVPGKMRAGGQSSVRFQRVRQNLLRDWLNKIADTMRELYSDIKDLKGIIIGGPGPIKEEVYQNYLDNETKKKVLGIVDTAYTDEYGLKEILERGKKYFLKEDVIREKELVGEFFEHIAKDDGLVIYGEEDVKNALEMGAVRVVLVSEDLPVEKLEEIVKMAKEYGSEVFIVSKDTDEGAQFNRFSKVAGILRFKI